jgi:hypothetical protein
LNELSGLSLVYVKMLMDLDNRHVFYKFQLSWCATLARLCHFELGHILFSIAITQMRSLVGVSAIKRLGKAQEY